jgi:hypothetical protein
MKMQLLSLQKLISVMDPSLYHHLEKVESLNLFFCFRWLLVCFKREFSYQEILMLWEAIWTAKLDEDERAAAPATTATTTTLQIPYRGISNHFQIFVALAILEHHRDILIKHLHNFDEMLQVSGVVEYSRSRSDCTSAYFLRHSLLPPFSPSDQ